MAAWDKNLCVGPLEHCAGLVQDAGRLQKCKQVVVNLSEDCLWNLLSALSNTGEAPTTDRSWGHLLSFFCIGGARFKEMVPGTVTF